MYFFDLIRLKPLCKINRTAIERIFCDKTSTVLKIGKSPSETEKFRQQGHDIEMDDLFVETNFQINSKCTFISSLGTNLSEKLIRLPSNGSFERNFQQMDTFVNYSLNPYILFNRKDSETVDVLVQSNVQIDSKCTFFYLIRLKSISKIN